MMRLKLSLVVAFTCLQSFCRNQVLCKLTGPFRLSSCGLRVIMMPVTLLVLLSSVDYSNQRNALLWFSPGFQKASLS
jgi:hypothetical protein